MRDAPVATSSDAFALVNRLLADSRLAGHRLQMPPGAVTVRRRRLRTVGNPVALPPRQTAGLALEPVLQARVSMHVYGEGPLTLAETGTFLAAATAGDARDWGAERQAGADLDLVLLARHVTGLAPAMYQYVPRRHHLLPIGHLPAAGAAELVIQAEFARAPALLFAVGNLAAALERHGSHGHRQLLVRAGAVLHHAWLGALSLGLAGCIFAGLLPNALRDLAGTDGYTRMPLLALAVGRAPAPTAPAER